MRMMSYRTSTDHGNELKAPSSFKDLELLPLITYSHPKNTIFSPTNQVTNYSAKSAQDNNKSCNFVNVTEQHCQRKDLNIARGDSLPLQSTRWSPTPEQLMALQELYRCGTRTPTAEQIQEITAKLRRFGKIEGKNVFYWFQNHKARDKKKQRLKMEPQHRLKAERRQFDYSKTLETKASVVSSGPRVTGLQVEQTKREPLSNYSRISEESVNSVPRVTIAETERGGTNKLVAFEEERESLQPIKPMEIMSYTFPTYNYDLKRTRPTVISLTFDEKLLMEKAQDYSTIVSLMPNSKASFTSFGNFRISREGCTSTSTATTITTLELFPLQSDNLKGAKSNDQVTKMPSGTRDTDFKQDLSLSFYL